MASSRSPSSISLLTDIQIRVVVAAVVRHAAVADFDDAGGDALHEVPVVAGEDDRALVVEQRLGQRLDRVDVEMVARFVEHQHVVLAEQQARQAEPGPFAAGEDRDLLLHVRRRGTAARRPGRESPASSCPAAALYSRYSSTVCFSGRLV